jgi:hypothetical protein
MKGPERRQTPRTTLERHAYINIEPNNGGIVLNVSEGGLCFHSFDPVKRDGKVRFWFSDHNQRIEADGAVAWADETQKGGMRFAALPPEAREKIREWMSQPGVIAAEVGSSPVGPKPRVFSAGASRMPATTVVPRDPVPVAAVSSELQIRKPLSGFSRGLATGLLFSAVVVAAVLFQSYRHEFGESLIRLGERFAAKPQTETLTVSAAAPADLPPPETVSPPMRPVSSAPQTVVSKPQAASIPIQQPVKVIPEPEVVVRQADKLVPQTVAPQAAAKVTPQPVKLDPPKPNTPSTLAGNSSPKPVAAAAPTVSSMPPKASSPSAAPPTQPAPATTPSLTPVKVAAASKLDEANQAGVHTEGSAAENTFLSRELYFEVGRFKTESQAHDETDKLAQLGFPVTAVQKGFLWTNSTRVLVGPYGDEDRAKLTQDNLLAKGFKPRPFEKGSRDLTLLSTVTLNGDPAPEGDYVVTWESYIGDASVKFMRNNSVVAKADGKWVKRDVRYPRDAYVYRRNPDGSRTLLEIHFGGMRQALVFGKAS